MVYKIVRTDELYHHGVKGMKWGVRKEEKAYAKDAKNEYKQERKSIKKASDKIFKDYVNAQKANSKAYKSYKQEQKKSLKNQGIDKNAYKSNIRKARSDKFKANKSAEYAMAIGQYHIQKRIHANNMVYALDTGNTKAYEKGKKAFYRDTEYTAWGNSMYKITKNKNGSYSITRTDVYVY